MKGLLVMAVIAGRRCAFSAVDVSSVIDIGEITPIPLAPAYVAGMTALRSQALTVIDARRSINCDPDNYTTDPRAAVVSVAGHSYALLVDTVDDIGETASETTSVAGGLGKDWERIASGMIETSLGPAIMIDIPAMVRGPGHGAEAA